VLALEDAVARVLAALPSPGAEHIPLPAAAGRVLAADITAPMDLPPFDNSAMDGYAVRAADTAGATAEAPHQLKLKARIAAGEVFAGEIQSGECARIFTGSPLPRDADAVVMQEDTALSGEVFVCDAVRPGENVRRRGEDVSQGTRLAERGAVLTPGRIGLLGAVGLAALPVARQPVVGLLATGSELREAGSVLLPGQIYESNRAMLQPLITQAGGVPRVFPLVPDTLAATQEALTRAFAACDLVVTSGGVSVGETDFVKAAFEALGGKLDFWKVAMRPGKPFVFGQLDGKFLFGLPGNPVSAFVTFLLLVRPALRQWQGARDVTLPQFPGVLGEDVSNPGDRRHFMRVRCDSGGKVFSAGKQAAHALGSLAVAEGLLAVPPQTNWAAGTAVGVLRWG
jgi:molybdopterin molybdotransferase